METLQKKTVAIGITSLVIFVSLVFIAKIQVGEALAAILVLLSVFTAIDLAAKTDILTKRHRQFACVTIGILAVAAIAVFEYLISIEPDHASTASNAIPNSTSSVTAATERKADETYDIAMSYYENGNYEEAIKTLRKVKSTSDYYTDAQELLAKITDYYYPLLMERAKTYAENGDYKMATSILDLAVLVFPGDEEILQTLKEYSVAYTTQIRTTAIENAKEATENNDYASAFQDIQSAIDEIGNDAELTALYDSYTTKYREVVLNQASAIFCSEGYLSAIEIINEGLRFLPSDGEFLSAIEEYQTYKPISLDTLEIWQYGDFTCGPYSHKTVTDNYGNTYDTFYSGTSASGFPGMSRSFFNVYKLDGKYTTLTGSFCIEKKYNSINDESELYIFGDDTLLAKYTIKGGDSPIEFSVDISGISLLTIRPDSAVFGMEMKEVSFVANLMLWK